MDTDPGSKVVHGYRTLYLYMYMLQSLYYRRSGFTKLNLLCNYKFIVHEPIQIVN